jgi:phosphatidylserine/phosphatidylglycerophosphate/cardiolipin synthase-like enzyme
VAQALVDAKMRGLRVDVLLDWGAEKDAACELKFLLDQGLTPLINAQYMSSHDKVVLIDGQTVITGSFDFTQQAEEENAENLVVLKGQPAVAKAYRDRFETMKAKCQPPGAKATPGDLNQKKAA